MAGETGAPSDEMLLEMLLTFAIARRDVRLLAQKLLETFGSLSQVLSASPDDLYKVKGLGESSVALLKVVNFIQPAAKPTEKKSPQAIKEDIAQLKLFEGQTQYQAPNHRDAEFQSFMNRESKPVISFPQQKTQQEILNSPAVVDAAAVSQRSTPPSKKAPSPKKVAQRKFQVSNGYLLEFDQLARVLHFLLEHRGAKKINRKTLREDTGLADRQVEGLVSMGSAMGLIRPGVQLLTPAGMLIAEHDLFLERLGTLEWCHYKGAGSYQNLIWFEVFNRLLTEESAMTQEGWQEYYRKKLKSQYTDKTIKDHVPKEVRFIVDAYTNRNFKKLELLNISSDNRLYRRRYSSFAPLVLAAMIYDFCATKETHLFQVSEMANMQGSPAVVFGLDEGLFRQQIEGIHDRGWLRYETTHNLDQIRLKQDFSAIEFLTAHFEDREPHAVSNQSAGGISQ